MKQHPAGGYSVMPGMAIIIGTAGWSIPAAIADCAPAEGTALERYASLFPGVEINSSFHRPHRQSTWTRWRDSVPDDFRFSVKVPKDITHVRKLVDCGEALAQFLLESSGLGSKLAVLLVQLPPKLAFDWTVAGPFFDQLRGRTAATIVCEPRHPSWFSDEGNDRLAEAGVARVAADPAMCAAAAVPGGWTGLRYWRLHGSPVIYRSSYGDRLGDYAAELRTASEDGRDCWCIFDNTASSAAGVDALDLVRLLADSRH